MTLRVNLVLTEDADKLIHDHLSALSPRDRARKLKMLAYAGLLMESGRSPGPATQSQPVEPQKPESVLPAPRVSTAAPSARSVEPEVVPSPVVVPVAAVSAPAAAAAVIANGNSFSTMDIDADVLGDFL